MNKKKFLFIIISMLLIAVIVFISKIQFVNKREFCTVAIIDGELANYEKGEVHLITKTNNRINTKMNSHGAKMIGFLERLCVDYEVYYYDASDNNGTVRTSLIELGISMLEEIPVANINISLSGMIFSTNLEETINNSIKKIYASYNNELSSLDYPAMYEGVIGVGIKQNVNFKKEDVFYNSNRIIIKDKWNTIYSGNSYLSLIESIKEESRWK